MGCKAFSEGKRAIDFYGANNPRQELSVYRIT